MSPRLLLVLAAVLFSTGGAAIKAVDFSAWQVASLRSGIAAAALLLFLPASRRGWGWRPVALGAAYAATMILFVLSNRLTTSANAVFIQATSPVYLVFLAPLLLGEPTRRRDLLFMLPLVGGLACFLFGSPDPSRTAPDPFTGNLLAGLSGVCWALTTIGLRWLATGDERRGTPLAAMVAGNLLAFGIALPFALPLPTGQAAQDWALLLYLGLFQIALPYSLIAMAMGRVRALDASLIFLVEPAFNPVVTWVVHREVPGPWPLAGAVVILATTVARALDDARIRRTLDPPAGAA